MPSTSMNLLCGKNLLRNFYSSVFQFVITWVGWSKYHSFAFPINEWGNNLVNTTSSSSSDTPSVPENSKNFVIWWKSKLAKRLTYKIWRSSIFISVCLVFLGGLTMWASRHGSFTKMRRDEFVLPSSLDLSKKVVNPPSVFTSWCFSLSLYFLP